MCTVQAAFFYQCHALWNTESCSKITIHPRRGTKTASILSRNGEGPGWEMLADIGQWLKDPSKIVTTTRPDLVLWSNTLRTVYSVELSPLGVCH